MKTIDRFDIYMKYKHLNDNKVTIQLGLSNGTIGKSRQEGRDLSPKVIEQILNFYSDLNRSWLLYGEGEMLSPSASQHVTGNENTSVNGGNVTTVGNIGGATNSPVTVNGAGAELSRMLDELMEQNRSQREQIHSLTEIIKNLTAR